MSKKTKIESGSIVRFKDSYTGYFKHLIGLNFIVDRVIPADREGNHVRVTLLEIDEIHLIGMHHLELAEENENVAV